THEGATMRMRSVIAAMPATGSCRLARRLHGAGRADEPVARPAIRAHRLAARLDVQEDARMARPERHRGVGAVQRQILRRHLDRRVPGAPRGSRFAHLQWAATRAALRGVSPAAVPPTGLSQALYLALRPPTTSKNIDCSFCVIGPRRPEPMA